MYNDQVNNVLDVEGPVLYIDAPSVERYLAGPRGDDQKGYTIFFINWYGRNDFKFHVYTKTDEPDPDTEVQLRPAPGLAEDHRVGRHFVPDLVLRSVRRSRGLDQQLDRG